MQNHAAETDADVLVVNVSKADVVSDEMDATKSATADGPPVRTKAALKELPERAEDSPTSAAPPPKDGEKPEATPDNAETPMEEEKDAADETEEDSRREAPSEDPSSASDSDTSSGDETAPALRQEVAPDMGRPTKGEPKGLRRLRAWAARITLEPFSEKMTASLQGLTYVINNLDTWRKLENGVKSEVASTNVVSFDLAYLGGCREYCDLPPWAKVAWVVVGVGRGVALLFDIETLALDGGWQEPAELGKVLPPAMKAILEDDDILLVGNDISRTNEQECKVFGLRLSKRRCDTNYLHSLLIVDGIFPAPGSDKESLKIAVGAAMFSLYKYHNHPMKREDYERVYGPTGCDEWPASRDAAILYAWEKPPLDAAENFLAMRTLEPLLLVWRFVLHRYAACRRKPDESAPAMFRQMLDMVTEERTSVTADGVYKFHLRCDEDGYIDPYENAARAAERDAQRETDRAQREATPPCFKHLKSLLLEGKRGAELMAEFEAGATAKPRPSASDDYVDRAPSERNGRRSWGCPTSWTKCRRRVPSRARSGSMGTRRRRKAPKSFPKTRGGGRRPSTARRRSASSRASAPRSQKNTRGRGNRGRSGDCSRQGRRRKSTSGASATRTATRTPGRATTSPPWACQRTFSSSAPPTTATGSCTTSKKPSPGPRSCLRGRRPRRSTRWSAAATGPSGAAGVAVPKATW